MWLLLFGGGAVAASAASLCIRRHPVAPALWFLVSMHCVGGTLLVLGADFLAAVLVGVAAIASMLTILLGLELQSFERSGFSRPRDRLVKACVVLALLAGAANALRAVASTTFGEARASHLSIGDLGGVLYGEAILVAELISLLLASVWLAVLATTDPRGEA